MYEFCSSFGVWRLMFGIGVGLGASKFDAVNVVLEGHPAEGLQ